MNEKQIARIMELTSLYIVFYCIKTVSRYLSTGNIIRENTPGIFITLKNPTHYTSLTLLFPGRGTGSYREQINQWPMIRT